MRYLIFRCHKCGLPLYSKKFQKSKKCPGCSKTINIKTIKKIKEVNDLQVAVEVVKQLKTPREIRNEIKVKFSKFRFKKPFFDQILEIIKDLSSKSEDGFTELEFKNKLTWFNLNDKKIEDLFEKLWKEGYIYQKKLGYYKCI